MNKFFTPLGWMFLALALIFLMGLLKPFARHFYPGSPNVLRRSAAPIIFAALAVACFKGAGLPAMLTVVALGVGCLVLGKRVRIS